MITEVEIFKALGDESRLRALIALGNFELCVCQLVELLGLAPSTVSKHMSVLKGAGLVESRKEGRWVHYLTTETGRRTLASEVLIAAANREQIARDRESLKEILKLDKNVLCERQRRC